MQKKSIAFLMGIIFITTTYGMHQKYSDSDTGLYTMGEKLHEAIKEENKISCPVGIHNTLGLLHSITPDHHIQKELTDFTGPDIEKHTKNLNKHFQNHCKPHAPESKYDRTQFDFSNNLYVLLSNQLSFTPEHEAPFKNLGAQISKVDFSKGEETAETVNTLAKEDTRHKIPSILSPNDFSSDSVCLFLHTLYMSSSWEHKGDNTKIIFTNLDGTSDEVNGFKVLGQNFHFSQKDNLTLIAIPAFNDIYMVIRHNSKDSKDLTIPSKKSIQALLRKNPKYLGYLKVPNLSMTGNLNLKNLLGSNLPQILTSPFQTTIVSDTIEIGNYLQKTTFKINKNGIKASAATAMTCVRKMSSFGSNEDEILINSPFTFALIQKKNKKNIPLFYGQVSNTAVMKKAGTSKR